MDFALYLVVFMGAGLGAFLGAFVAVSLAEKYFSRQQDSKLYDTVFSGPPEPPEPIGDRLISPEEYAALQSDETCDSPEPKTTGLGWPPKMMASPPPPDKENSVGWSDNNAAGIYNKKESKSLPGNLGGRR